MSEKQEPGVERNEKPERRELSKMRTQPPHPFRVCDLLSSGGKEAIGGDYLNLNTPTLQHTPLKLGAFFSGDVIPVTRTYPSV